MRYIKFLYDYRGQFTREQYYTAGTVAEVTDATAQALILNNRAIAAKAPETMNKTKLRAKPVSTLRELAAAQGIDAEGLKKGELLDALLGV